VKTAMQKSGNDGNPSAPRGYAAEHRASVHPAWVAFIRLCRELGHGEIENLKIQDGLPISAEMIRTKIRFTS